MGLHAQEHVGEVLDGIHAVRLAGRDERIEAREVLTGLVVPDKQEVLSPEGCDP